MTSHAKTPTILTLSAEPSHDLADNGSLTDRRRHGIEALPDGRLVDRDVERAWLAAMVPELVRVERLSLTDPEIAAFNATARGSRA